MACDFNMAMLRSAQTAYNDAVQTFAVGGGTVSILGTQVCDAGCSVDTEAAGFSVRREGVYRFAYDLVFTASGAGTVTVQLYNGTSAMPCASAQFTAADGDVYPVHVETTVPLRACYGVRPVISCQVSGVAGSVTHVCANAVKIA